MIRNVTNTSHRKSQSSGPDYIPNTSFTCGMYMRLGYYVPVFESVEKLCLL